MEYIFVKIVVIFYNVSRIASISNFGGGDW